MIEVTIGSDKRFTVEKRKGTTYINGTPTAFKCQRTGEHTFRVFKDNRIYLVEVLEREGGEMLLNVDGQPVPVKTSDHLDQMLEKLGMNTSASPVVKQVKAPMPGTILQIAVKKGEKITKGSPLFILEAMKMENVIKSPRDGIIGEVLVATGENVEKNQGMVVFE